MRRSRLTKLPLDEWHDGVLWLLAQLLLGLAGKVGERVRSPSCPVVMHASGRIAPKTDSAWAGGPLGVRPERVLTEETTKG